MTEYGSLGKITAPTPGTPVPLTATPVYVRGFRAEAVAGATGRVTLGTIGLKKSTGAGVIKNFAAPAAGVNSVTDSFERDSDHGTGNLIDLSRFMLDPDVANEGLIVSYWKD